MRARPKLSLKRLAVGLLTVFQLNTVAFYAWADSIAASASLGQQTARVVTQEFDPTAAQVTLQDLFPDLVGGDVTNLEQVYGNDARTLDLGLEENAKLATEGSERGDAYRVLQGNLNRTPPDLSNDPLFNQADRVREPDFMQGFKENFADCKKTDVFEEIQGKAHVPKYETCERLVKPEGNCEISHEIIIKAAPADIVFLVDNSASMDSVIAELRTSVSNLAMILGDRNDGDLRLGGVVTRGDQFVSNNAGLSENISQFQAWINAVRTNGGQTYNVNAANYVIDTFSWREGVEKVLVIIGNIDKPNGDAAILRAKMDSLGFRAFIFHDNDGIKSLGQHIVDRFSATALFKMSQFLTVVEDYWTPESCLDAAKATLEEFCSGSYQEVVGAAGGCLNLSGFDVCPGDPIYNQIKAPPIPNVDRLALKVKVSALDCSYNIGQMDCWVDPQGVQRCPNNEGGELNTCKQYEADANCGFVSQKCIGNAEGSLGTCYAYEEVWDCGYDVNYPTIVNTGQTIECPGGARCMGSECFDTSNTKSKDFAYAVAMLQVAQFAEHDLDCGSEGSLDCKVFKGEAMECKKALGGYVDCCEAPESVSIFDYVNLTMNTMKMASSLEALYSDGSLFAPGYWQAGSSAITSAGTAVIEGQWGSIVDAATGAWKDTFAGVVQDTLVSKLQEWLMQQAYNAMVDMGATAAANAVFQTGTSAAGEATISLSANAAMVVNIIGWVYMIYVIVDLLINIIWECEQKEFELGAKMETGQCHFVGSYCASEALGSCVEKREAYCCFGSVVGRLIQQQGREQLGLDFGEPETPSCDGLTPDQLAQMDWDKIDLSEWIGMLSLTGHLPTASTISIDHLTGAGSSLGDITDGQRLNSLDRNMSRLEGFDVDAVKRKAEQERRQQ